MTAENCTLQPAPLGLRAERCTTLAYSRALAFHPVSLSGVVLALGIVTSYLGALGAVIVLTAYALACTGAARAACVQHALDGNVAQRARVRREAGRERRLRRAAPVRKLQYGEVRTTIEDIERAYPLDARRFELEALLDRFVYLAVAHGRCTEAVRLADPITLSTLAAPGTRSRAIAERRVVHRDACQRRLEQLGDELDAIEQLVRLIQQRVTCPLAVEEDDGEIERRLWELDELDEAFRELGADQASDEACRASSAEIAD